MSEFSEYSKELGWVCEQIVGFPSMVSVLESSWKNRLMWTRFLRSPNTTEELEIMDRIIKMGNRPKE